MRAEPLLQLLARTAAVAHGRQLVWGVTILVVAQNDGVVLACILCVCRGEKRQVVRHIAGMCKTENGGQDQHTHGNRSHLRHRRKKTKRTSDRHDEQCALTIGTDNRHYQ